MHIDAITSKASTASALSKFNSFSTRFVPKERDDSKNMDIIRFLSRLSDEEVVEGDWDKFVERWKKLKKDHKEKYAEFRENLLKKNMIFDKELILNIEQLNDDLDKIEIELLLSFNLIKNKKVTWIKEDGEYLITKTEIFEKEIAGIREDRNIREQILSTFEKILFIKDKSLWEDFKNYRESLKIQYDAETVINDDSVELPNDSKNNNNLEYWTGWR